MFPWLHVINFKEEISIPFIDGHILHCSPDEPRVIPTSLRDWMLQDPLFAGKCEIIGKLEDFITVHQKWDSEAIEASHVVIGVEAMIGDALFMTPIFRQLRKDYPDKTIDVVIHAAHYPVLKNNPSISNLWSFPVKLSKLKDVHFIAAQHGLDVFFDPDMDATDTAAMFFGIKIEDHTLDCTPDRGIKKEYHNWLNGTKPIGRNRRFFKPPVWDNYDLPIVMFQLASSSLLRTFPPMRLLEISEVIIRSGKANCMIVGMPDQLVMFLADIQETRDGNIANFEFLKDYKTIFASSMIAGVADLMGLVSNADVIVGSDSGLIHLGSAFHIPTVTLYTSVPPKARLQFHPCVTILEGSRPSCYPCWADYKSPCLNPDDYGFGTCCEGITNQQVIDAILESLPKC
jgi:ADP-heptose:LPS heptosyltransferase